MARSKKTPSLEVNSSPRTRRTPSPSRTRSPPSPESERPPGPLSVTTVVDRDAIKVNNANATELKNACDDAVKRVSTPLTVNSTQSSPTSCLHCLLSLYLAGSKCTNADRTLPLSSIYHDQNFSNKSICTQMCVLLWDGLAYLLPLGQPSTGTKSTSRNLSPWSP